MRITKVNIPKSTADNDGLEDIKMEKLGHVVLMAGKNGSGKTRILNKVFNAYQNKITKGVFEQLQMSIKTEQENIINIKQRLENNQDQLIARERNFQNGIPDRERHRLEHSIKGLQESLENAPKHIAQWQESLNNQQVETSEYDDHYTFVHFVPKSLSLSDPYKLPKHEMIQASARVDTIGINQLPGGTFAKIQVIQDRWFNSTHQLTEVRQDEQILATKNYEKLKDLIGVFLNTDIGRTINDEATLFGFPLGKTQLSDGQKILLQFCLAIYAQDTALQNIILVLDEPENHLHPSVIIETIERIQQCVTNGQIWIATHSVPLLAHFDPSLIWYVEESSIKHAGKIPEKVLHSLLGDEEEVAKLQDFISLPAQYATSRYAFESLFEPGAVLTDSKDPQSFQIRTDLLSLSKDGKLRILDYGAGKGRLISNIVDLDETKQEKLIENIDYIAYDKYSDDKEQCEAALVKAYGNCDKRYFNDMTNLLSVYDKKSFDIVIMCNVLHEIDPIDWITLFKPNGLISGLISDSGILLLVEDHQIPIGEKAYQKGFLVLDTPHLKDLFQISESDTNFNFTDQKGDGRLKAHQIPKSCLIRINENSRIAAIQSMSETARENILEIRNKEKNYHNGKLHGFWTQQFANAQLNLSQFKAN